MVLFLLNFFVELNILIFKLIWLFDNIGFEVVIVIFGLFFLVWGVFLICDLFLLFYVVEVFELGIFWFNLLELIELVIVLELEFFLEDEVVEFVFLIFEFVDVICCFFWIVKIILFVLILLFFLISLYCLFLLVFKCIRLCVLLIFFIFVFLILEFFLSLKLFICFLVLVVLIVIFFFKLIVFLFNWMLKDEFNVLVSIGNIFYWLIIIIRDKKIKNIFFIWWFFILNVFCNYLWLLEIKIVFVMFIIVSFNCVVFVFFFIWGCFFKLLIMFLNDFKSNLFFLFLFFFCWFVLIIFIWFVWDIILVGKICGFLFLVILGFVC